MPKPALRFQAQLLVRRSYKPGRRTVIRVRPVAAGSAPMRDAEHGPDCAPEGAWTLTRTE